MSNSEDVKALFRRFGGNASTYQEIVSHDQVGQAEQRWPMLKQINPAHHDEAPSVRRLDSLGGPRQMQVELPTPQVRVWESAAALVPAPVAEPPRGGLFGRSAAAAPRSDAVGAAPPPAEPPRIAGGGGLASPGASLHKALASSPTQRNAPQPKALSGFLGSRRTPLTQPAHAEAAAEREAAATQQPALPSASESAAKSGVGRMLGGALGALRGRKPAEMEVKIDPPSVQERPTASGLGQVFANKLATPAASPALSKVPGASKVGAEAGGLVRLFESMLAPLPPAEVPKGLGRGKKVVKW